MALILVLVGCGRETDSPTLETDASQSPLPTQLTCPSGERVATDGGYLAEIPDGFDTREEAVEAFLSDDDAFSDDYAITADGKGAWVLRPDGTAEARLDFLRHSGFTVHGYEACA